MEEGANLTLAKMRVLPKFSDLPHRDSISTKPLDIVSIKHSSSPDDVELATSPKIVTITGASGPPSPREGAIPNFGAIDKAKGIYRSSFPQSCNIKHLESLNLKTIVTLVTTAFDADVEEWLASSGVQHFCIKIPPHKSSEDTIPMESIAQVMKLMIDETKRPILIHCNKGKHRTGCMTACFRKLHGLDDIHAITEYYEYARPKPRYYDIAYIAKIHFKDISQAIFNLKTLAEAVEHHHQPDHNSNAMRSISATKEAKFDVDVANGRGFKTAEECEASDVPLHHLVAGRLIIHPEPSMSPPFPAPFHVGFSAKDLADALSKIRDGGDMGALTPPTTPEDESRSECSQSADEYS